MPQPNRVHKLKTWPVYFEAVKAGIKRFEIRNNDREFRAGDWVVLQEWDPDGEEYTGREIDTRIIYVTEFGQPEGQVVFGIRVAIDEIDKRRRMVDE